MSVARKIEQISPYQSLQKKFTDVDVIAYSEFIIGLPGETYETWKAGLDQTVDCGLRGDVLTYPLAAPSDIDISDYRRLYCVGTHRIEIAEIHRAARSDGTVAEYENIVTQTDSMSVEEWRRMMLYSYFFGAFYCMKLANFIMLYLRDRYDVYPSEFISYLMDEGLSQGDSSPIRAEMESHNRHLDAVLNDGCPVAMIIPEFGDVYWSGEEATYLRLVTNPDFFAELMMAVVIFVESRGLRWDAHELGLILSYQALRLPQLHLKDVNRFYRDLAKNPRTDDGFTYNVHEYFETMFTSEPMPLIRTYRPERYAIAQTDFGGDKKKFAHDIVLRGRKSGGLLYPVITEAAVQ